MDTYNEITKQIGYDPKVHSFEDFNLWKTLDYQTMHLYFNEDYIIDMDVRVGTHIRNHQFESVFLQERVEDHFLHFTTLYRDKVFFMNYGYKKNFCLNLSNQQLSEIPFQSVVNGIKVDHLQICAYRHKLWLYDLEKEEVVWESVYPELEGRVNVNQWFSRFLYWNNSMVITDMRYSKLQSFEMHTGKKQWEIHPKDIEEFKEHRSIGQFYVVGDLLIGHSEIKGKHDLNDYKNKGYRALYALDLNTAKVKWQRTITQWINRYVSSKNVFHSFYFHAELQEICYQEIDLNSGEILFDFSIQERLDHLKLRENIEEYIEMLNVSPQLGAMLYANEKLYFSYGSYYLSLDAQTQLIDMVYRHYDLTPFGGTPRIVGDLMIMNMEIFKLS